MHCMVNDKGHASEMVSSSLGQIHADCFLHLQAKKKHDQEKGCVKNGWKETAKGEGSMDKLSV